MQAQTLEGGFADPPMQAAAAFRSVMEAMARPGTIQSITGAVPPAPLSPAAGAVLLTLCDGDTPIHLAGEHDTPEIRGWIAFHTGAPWASRADCAFALGSFEALMPLEDYPMGTPEYPDRSATLILEMPELEASGAELRGPGIKDRALLSLPEIAPFQTNRARFPLGLDFILTAGDRIAALPRSTEVR
ncbi:phosphonate C-P lyase system protein PhnH [Dinoroseobacter sp. S76]|uniref:phosphonate C-P lyase system protein PhnH n=1 Tax=Dinoroseobacter sp. S76 TaxID=3415124 RepID=UPI003C7EBB42